MKPNRIGDVRGDHFNRPSIKRTALTNQDMQAFFSEKPADDDDVSGDQDCEFAFSPPNQQA